MTVEEALARLLGIYGDAYEVFKEKARELLEAVRSEAYAEGCSDGQHPDDV